MGETLEESYNKLVDIYDALEEAMIEICDVDTQRKNNTTKKGTTIREILEWLDGGKGFQGIEFKKNKER